MKLHAKRFTYPEGSKAIVILPEAEYEALIEMLEDYEDLEAIREYEENPGEMFPLEFVNRLATENRVKVFREHRNITQAELARRAETSRQYISQIEAGQRTGSIKLLKKIAGVLDADLDDLVED